MRKLTMALAVVAAMYGVQGASAQNTEVNAGASITIPQLLSIDVSNTAVTFAQPALADWNAGYIGNSSAASVVDTRGNVTHRVTISADAATMGYAGDEDDPLKPAGDLQWSNSGGSFAGLTTGGANVVSGLSRGSNTAAAEVSYRMLLSDAADVPGTYSLAFTFTVVAD